MDKTTSREPDPERRGTPDLMNIAGDSIPELDAVTNQLLDRGRTERVMILSGTEGGRTRQPYATTHISIDFATEEELRKCVQLLRWSDDRLRARPEQMIRWEWDKTYREGMTISFGVAWYDREFFERRKEAFREPSHASYYAMFGATPDRFKVTHEIL